MLLADVKTTNSFFAFVAEGYKDPVHLFDGGDVLIVMKESLGDVPM